jgi:hypothetical protein
MTLAKSSCQLCHFWFLLVYTPSHVQTAFQVFGSNFWALMYWHRFAAIPEASDTAAFSSDSSSPLQTWIWDFVSLRSFLIAL